MKSLFLMATEKIGVNEIGIRAVEADTIVVDVLNTAYFAAGIVAVIVLIIAGIQYSTSDGDSTRVGKAKNAILYAIVGLVIILGAFMITGFISGRIVT